MFKSWAALNPPGGLQLDALANSHSLLSLGNLFILQYQNYSEAQMHLAGTHNSTKGTSTLISARKFGAVIWNCMLLLLPTY